LNVGFHHQYTQCWTQAQDVATLKGLPDVNGEWLASTLTGNIGKHQAFSSYMEDTPFFQSVFLLFDMQPEIALYASYFFKK